ncbi:tRNA (guanine(27)-N(2))-dimethyltransferase-like [Styela clava]
MTECTLSELGISAKYTKDFLTKLGNQWHTAKRLHTPRLFSLLALSQIIEEFQGAGMTALSCIDAVPGLGMSGMIWAKHFGKNVSVTINLHDEIYMKNCLEKNLKNNILENNVSIVCRNPNSLLHESNKRYNMIYLEAYGTCVRYLEAACFSICHRGVLCIVSTDLCTLYNKCPERVPRIYHGQAMKHEYGKELAVRLILANVARSASRWDRGISVLSSYVDENSIVLLVRILKGATHANKSLDFIQRVAHCRVCHYRQVLNEKLYYVPMPDITDCFCKDGGITDENVQPPIVMLGPAYIGPIFDTNFVIQMAKTLTQIDIKNKLVPVMQNMTLESLCLDSDEQEVEIIKLYKETIETQKMSKSQDANEPSAKRLKPNDSLESIIQKYSSETCPIFYYIVESHTKKGSNPLRILASIQKLRSVGFRACGTLFDPRGVRTTASPREFRKVINSITSD